MQTQGQAQDIKRATGGHFEDKERLKRIYEDKPRTSRGQKRTCEGHPPRESAVLPKLSSILLLPEKIAGSCLSSTT